MVLKIASGVFIGGLALFAAIKGPGAIGRLMDERRQDNAHSILHNTTPEKLILKCGKPEHDTTTYYKGTDKRTEFRVIIYKAKYHDELHFTYFRNLSEPDNWGLVSVGDNYFKTKSDEIVLFDMPCIENPDSVTGWKPAK